MTSFSLIDVPTFGDARGTLSVADGLLPFPAVRIYWIYGAAGRTRGGHRHGKTRQALIAVHGVVSIYMDDGSNSETFVLDTPSKCLIVEPKDWHTMTFGPDSVLLVIASHPFDPNDYFDEVEK